VRNECLGFRRSTPDCVRVDGLADAVGQRPLTDVLQNSSASPGPMAGWSIVWVHIRGHHRLPVIVGFDLFLCEQETQRFAVLADAVRAPVASKAIVPNPKVPTGAVALRNGQVRVRGGFSGIHIRRSVPAARSRRQMPKHVRG